MEHFDDMLRNSLANDFPENRFEFREEYWLQAQALIEAYEAKRKRRAVWWSISSLLVAGAVVLAFYNRDYLMHQPGAAPAVQPPAIQSIEPKIPATEPMAHVAQPTDEPFQSESQFTPRQQQPGTATSETFRHANNSKGYNSNEPNRALITENNRLPASANGSSQKTALQHSSANLPTSNEVTPHRETVLPSAEQSVAYTPQLPVELPLVPILLMEQVKSDGAVVRPVIAQVSIPDETQAPVVTKIHPDPVFRLGGVATVGTPSGIFNQEKPAVALGMTARYKLNERWSLNADMNWKRWKGKNLKGTSATQPTLDNSYTQEQIARTYSFGYSQTRTTTTLRSFHFLELPVSIERHWGKISAETGVQLSFLLASRSDTEQFKSQSLSTAEDKTFSAAVYSGSKNPFVKSFFPGIFAGINYQPARHWSIGIRGGWRTPSNVVYNKMSAQYLDIPNNLNRSLTALNAEIRLRWLF